MPEILAVEMCALLLALVSVAVADLFYHTGRIVQLFHSLWVASSLTAMCLPIMIWLAVVFVGRGAPAWGLVAIVMAALFVGLLYNVGKLPANQRARQRLVSSVRQVPPTGP